MRPFDRRDCLGRLLFVIPLLTGAPFAGAAPASRDVVPGDLVRYVIPARDGWIRAKVLEVEGDRWLVQPEYLIHPSWIDTVSLRKAEVFRAKGPLVKKGFLVGFVPGAVFGASVAGIACLDYEGPGECPGLGGRLAFAAFVGGTTGGIGALIAKIAKPERWDPIVDGGARIIVSPMRGPRGRGLGATVAISFR